jgi:hypothetical protein
MRPVWQASGAGLARCRGPVGGIRPGDSGVRINAIWDERTASVNCAANTARNGTPQVMRNDWPR